MRLRTRNRGRNRNSGLRYPSWGVETTRRNLEEKGISKTNRFERVRLECDYQRETNVEISKFGDALAPPPPTRKPQEKISEEKGEVENELIFANLGTFDAECDYERETESEFEIWGLYSPRGHRKRTT